MPDPRGFQGPDEAEKPSNSAEREIQSHRNHFARLLTEDSEHTRRFSLRPVHRFLSGLLKSIGQRLILQLEESILQ